MSNPINLLKPASFAVLAIPTTPPAGPESIASLPAKKRASVSPPLDCINIKRPVCFASLPSAFSTWLT